MSKKYVDENTGLIITCQLHKFYDAKFLIVAAEGSKEFDD